MVLISAAQITWKSLCSTNSCFSNSKLALLFCFQVLQHSLPKQLEFYQFLYLTFNWRLISYRLLFSSLNALAVPNSLISSITVIYFKIHASTFYFLRILHDSPPVDMIVTLYHGSMAAWSFPLPLITAEEIPIHLWFWGDRSLKLLLEFVFPRVRSTNCLEQNSM